MTRRYYRVGPSFWSDHPEWDDDTRLLALYFLTCSHRTVEGLFRLPLAYVQVDLGWSAERLAKPFDQLLADGFLSYDERHQLVWIRNALKWQAPENPNQAKAAVKAVAELPQDSPVLREFLAFASTVSEWFAKALAERFPEGFSQGFAKPPSPSPSPSPSPPRPPAGGGREGALARRPTVDPDELPDGLTDEQRQLAVEVQAVLAKAHAECSPAAKPPTLRQTGMAIAAFPAIDHRAVAAELASWAVRPSRPIKDFAGTYRTFVRRRADDEARRAASQPGPRPAAPGEARSAFEAWERRERARLEDCRRRGVCFGCEQHEPVAPGDYCQACLDASGTRGPFRAFSGPVGGSVGGFPSSTSQKASDRTRAS